MSDPSSLSPSFDAGSPVLIVPDSFKGTIDARRVAMAIYRGVTEAGIPAVTYPVADGGEGTAEAIRLATGGEIRTAKAHDALGRPLEASFLLRPDHEDAFIDTAAASGLVLIEPERRDALAASTAGTGELVLAAVRAGARHVHVGAGGSATTDGGLGAIEAIERGGGLRGATLSVLCDARIPYEMAAAVFAPQKGATPDQVLTLTERLDSLGAELPRDPRGKPMTGSAGGLSGGLWAAFGATLHSGARFVLGAVGLHEALPRACAVITGEGRLDSQSLEGKLVGELARLCGRTGVPLHVLAGQVALGTDEIRGMGLASFAIAGTEDELRREGRRIALACSPALPASS